MELSISDIETLHGHRDYEQVVLDVNRSLKRFPPGESIIETNDGTRRGVLRGKILLIYYLSLTLFIILYLAINKKPSLGAYNRVEI